MCFLWFLLVFWGTRFLVPFVNHDSKFDPIHTSIIPNCLIGSRFTNFQTFLNLCLTGNFTMKKSFNIENCNRWAWWISAQGQQDYPLPNCVTWDSHRTYIRLDTAMYKFSHKKLKGLLLASLATLALHYVMYKLQPFSKTLE